MWAKIKIALNSTLGRKDFLPLNEIVKSEVEKSENRILSALGKLANNRFDLLAIPEGTTEIAESEYEGTGWNVVSIPSSVSKIGKSAFEDCSSLTSVMLPIGVKEIGEFAFYNCNSIKHLELPVGIETIGRGAFSGAGGLHGDEPNFRYVVIPEGVKFLPGSAFMPARIEKLYLPLTMEEIGVFSDSDLLSIAATVSSISYNGTFEMFNRIKGLNRLPFPLKEGTTGRGSITVYCSDGVFELEYTGQ